MEVLAIKDKCGVRGAKFNRKFKKDRLHHVQPPTNIQK